jgi:DNA modification methylase
MLERLPVSYQIYCDDCLAWANSQAEHTIQAIVTDPPFGHKEYTDLEQGKLRTGQGGVWRIPPSFDGSKRRPLPRFTVLTDEDLQEMWEFFRAWGQAMHRLLVPGGHIFIAANPLLSQYVWMALIEGGFEKRGEIVRLVRTFRGGDRPKGAHKEFADVCTMPRANWEPWGIFRKPFEGRVADNLRQWKAGALRRMSSETPLVDVIKSGRTPEEERKIAPHPSLKPQHFLRQLVWSALPLGEGIVLDPFMGGGSTIAAAKAVGYDSIGIERDPQYFEIAKGAITKLAALKSDTEDEVSFIITDEDNDLSSLPLFREIK